MNIKTLASAVIIALMISPAWSQTPVEEVQEPGFVEAAETEGLQTVEALLSRAVDALRHKNYKGRFTYEFGSVLETLELVHTVEEGIEHERILHLSGKKREFVRSGRPQECVTVGSLLLRGDHLIANGKLQRISNNYHLYIGADERVAGRDVTMVQVVPKDEYRYGLTLAFDKDSGLPLLSVLSSAKNTLERFQFVDIEVGGSVAQKDTLPSPGPFQSLAGSNTHCIEDADHQSVNSESQDWSVSWLPAGFVLAQAETTSNYESILTYTDGLAAFTVFVAPMQLNELESFKSGAARRGATLVMLNAAQYGTATKSVAVVGEVPLLTAKRVIASLSYNR